MPGLQEHEPSPERCAFCGALAAGMCASCHRSACGDCVEIVSGGTRPWAVCRDCAKHGGTSLRPAWFTLVAPVVALAAAIVAGVLLVRGLR